MRFVYYLLDSGRNQNVLYIQQQEGCENLIECIGLSQFDVFLGATGH